MAIKHHMVIKDLKKFEIITKEYIDPDYFKVKYFRFIDADGNQFLITAYLDEDFAGEIK